MSITSTARFAGFVLGAALALSLMVGAHISAPSGQAAAGIVVSAVPTGELAVSPGGSFISAPQLIAGAPATRGELALRNQTGVPLIVDLRVRSATGDLDDLLRVDVRSGDRSLFTGTLGGLGSGIAPIAIRPGQSRRLRIALRLRSADQRVAAGRTDNVALIFRTHTAERPR